MLLCCAALEGLVPGGPHSPTPPSPQTRNGATSRVGLPHSGSFASRFFCYLVRHSVQHIPPFFQHFFPLLFGILSVFFRHSFIPFFLFLFRHSFSTLPVLFRYLFGSFLILFRHFSASRSKMFFF